MAKQRLHLTAILVHKGVIQLITPTGEVALFAQRGLKKLSPDEAITAIEKGIISVRAFNLRELPAHISISFERPDIQGKAVASFNASTLYDRY